MATLYLLGPANDPMRFALDEARFLTRGTQQQQLDPTEFRLLLVLLENIGRELLSNEALTFKVRRGDATDPEWLKTYISRLRRTLRVDPALEEDPIQNVRSQGYKFAWKATKPTETRYPRLSSFGVAPTLEAFLGAVERDETTIVLCFVDEQVKGIDIDYHRPSDGRTPLMIALEQCSPRMVEILLDAKADPNAVDRRDTTPLQIAMYRAVQQKTDLLQAVQQKIPTDINMGKLIDAGATFPKGGDLLTWAQGRHHHHFACALIRKGEPNPLDKLLAERRRWSFYGSLWLVVLGSLFYLLARYQEKSFIDPTSYSGAVGVSLLLLSFLAFGTIWMLLRILLAAGLEISFYRRVSKSIEEGNALNTDNPDSGNGG